MFLREYIPQRHIDALRTEFEQSRLGTITISENVCCFSDMHIYAPALVSTVRERVRRFIEGLHPSVRTSMAREIEMDILYQ